MRLTDTQLQHMQHEVMYGPMSPHVLIDALMAERAELVAIAEAADYLVSRLDKYAEGHAGNIDRAFCRPLISAVAAYFALSPASGGGTGGESK